MCLGEARVMITRGPHISYLVDSIGRVEADYTPKEAKYVLRIQYFLCVF